MTVATNQIVVKIDEKQVLRDVGYDENCEPPARMTNLVHEYAEHTSQLINPAYSYVIRDIDFVRSPMISIGDGVAFQSRVISKLLEQCDEVAVFALTIDDPLEKIAGQIAEGGLIVQARVLDAIGSCAVEQVADHVQDTIRHEAGARGYCISRRFSPGYCDWEIDQQQMVFRAMNGSPPPVQLTDESLMVPRKSISGIIGIGTCDNAIEDYNPCLSCRRRDCPGRR